MSKTHNVQQGETLGAIAIRYLGNSVKWTNITGANPQLANRKKAVDGSPLIYPGDTLIIPEDQTESRPAAPQTKKPVVLSDKEQDVSIVIDGEKFTGFTAYNLTLAYDTFDTFSFSAPYDPEIKELREIIKPFTFKPCEVYYNDALMFKGTLLTPDPELTDQSSEITLQGYPLCGVLNDCMVPPTRYPLQCMGITMKGIADAACEPYSIPVIFEGEAGPVFTEVSIEPTDKILDFLSRLSKQRNLLFTNNEKGQLVFFNPKPEKAFVSFIEGKEPLISIKPKFNAQDFFSHITGFGKTDAEYPSLAYTFENKYLINKGIIRHHSLTIDDAETISDLENAVKAHAGRMFADCVNFELLCDNHVNENNEVFQKGMTVCVLAPSAMIMRETNFTARSVKLSRTTEGKTATLTLVLPGSYTGEIPEALPWE
ncbi:MAG: LysM peptidoglycan-binding domain-containing protein [Spirochaetaceae bacterium]|jgi:prophage tail gpP-like protein|nr:LysM peptidoglycan-binding domain-containing protein [Spirochaetaceae bacterium]